MQNSGILKRVVKLIFSSIVVFFLLMALLGWYENDNSRKMCNEFVDKTRQTPDLMDKTFGVLLSIKNIREFYSYGTENITIFYSSHKANNLKSAIDWHTLFDDFFGGYNYVLTYQHAPKYEQEVQNGTARLKMIESIYIGNSRIGLRFILKRTLNGKIDKANYDLEVECDLRGDIPRRIKIK